MNFFIPDFSQAKVLIVGDIMLDRYWHGPIQRISPEAPVPVLNVAKQEECPGGAANVALNVAALGAKAYLLGVCGDDVDGKTLNDKLHIAGVESHLLFDEKLKTIVKLRILGQRQQVIRLDFEEKAKQFDTKKLLATYESLIDKIDVVILSDYAKGTLQIAPELIKIAKQHHKKILVDPKRMDVDFYRGASLLTPNLKEFEAITGASHDLDDLVTRGQNLIKDEGLEALLVTRSEHGMSLLQANQTPVHMAAHQREVADVTGAGDTVIAMLGAAIACGMSYEVASRLANLAAGISVQKRNAATVSVAELRRAMWEERTYTDKHVVTEAELLTFVDDAKKYGEKIVMTNGCFDLLHPGHVAYLEQAKALGDRLIVAVNSDKSVKRLKGDSRPLNNIVARMSVLAGLRSVDWVVSFDEDTPARLIEAVKPNVLVKGGDWAVEQIVGYDTVMANGGEVLSLPFVEGYSTTSIIEKMQK